MKWGIIIVLMAFFLTALFGQAPAKEADSPKKVCVISLKGDIFEPLTREVLKKMQRVEPTQIKAVILEIDTPGGLVSAALEICRQIKILEESKIEVYAYITGFAWSGGALIALACDRIYMIEQASIGSAQVKVITPVGMEDADEKALSAMRAHFRAFAEHRGYPKALAEAMVDPSLEVHEVHYRGERFFKTAPELLKMRGEVQEAGQIIDRGIVVASGKLANFTAQEAKNFGFCKAICQTRADVLKEVNLSELEVVEFKSTSEDMLINFLTDRWIQIFLIALGLLGIFIEFWTPGFGVPGILGVTFLALAFVGGYLAETAAVWEIVLFIIGLALLAIEIFIIPGFGIVGITGIICCLLGILLSFQNFILPNNESEVNELMQNIFKLTLSLGIDIIVIFVLIRFLPEGAPLRRLSMTTVQNVEDGYTVAIPSFQDLVGKTGLVVAQLRPVGRATIDGKSYDVESQGDFFDIGTPVRVVEIQANRIIVDRIS